MNRSSKDYPAKTYRSAQLAGLAGVSTDTLRFYERKGLLPNPPRQKNNYRQYPLSALSRVQLIRSAFAIGFTTEELAFILKERESGGAPCTKVRHLAQHKLEEITKKIRHLVSNRKRLQQILQDWDHRLRSNSNGPARLLESLGSASPHRQGRTAKPRGKQL